MENEITKAIVKGTRIIHINKMIEINQEFIIEKGSEEWDTYINNSLQFSKSEFELNNGFGLWNIKPFRNQLANDVELNKELADSKILNELFSAQKIFIQTPDGIEEIIPI